MASFNFSRARKKPTGSLKRSTPTIATLIILSNRYEAALYSMVEAAGSVSLGLLLWYGGGEVLHACHRHRHVGGVSRVYPSIFRAAARLQPEIRGHAVGDGLGGKNLPVARYAGGY
jgi:hypothetical protein